MCNIPVFCQKYLIKVNFKDLSLLPNGLKVEPLDKPKTGLKFFVNTTKPKTKVLANFFKKLRQKSQL